MPYFARPLQRPIPEDDLKQPQRWAQLSVLLYLMATWLLMVQMLRLLGSRKSASPAGPGRVDTRGKTTGPSSCSVEHWDTPRAGLPRSDDAAFRAGVETAFDVIGVLRELVNEALASSHEHPVDAKSANGHRRGPGQGPQ